MPMCDIYIPEGALEPAAERKLVARISELLVEHEMRRIFDLVDDASSVKASIERAQSIAWMFVHRCDTYIAGKLTGAPHYKFVITIPEGTIDESFAPAVNKDIYSALEEAEDNRYPDLPLRVWVHIHEILDGRWGAAGRATSLKWIVDYVAPGMGTAAVARFDGSKRDAAAKLVSLGQPSGARA